MITWDVIVLLGNGLATTFGVEHVRAQLGLWQAYPTVARPLIGGMLGIVEGTITPNDFDERTGPASDELVRMLVDPTAAESLLRWVQHHRGQPLDGSDIDELCAGLCRAFLTPANRH